VTVGTAFVSVYGMTDSPLWLSDIALHFVRTPKRPLPRRALPPYTLPPPPPPSAAGVPADAPAGDYSSEYDFYFQPYDEFPEAVLTARGGALWLTGVSVREGRGAASDAGFQPPYANAIYTNVARVYAAGALGIQVCSLPRCDIVVTAMIQP
jgi:hypothetical protein